jgi:hypothetical protein
MRPSLRFLALAVIGWAGIRAATLGALPGAEIFRVERSEAKPPPIVATEFPPIEPLAAAPADAASVDMRQAAFPYEPVSAQSGGPRTVFVPVYYAASSVPPPFSLGRTQLANALPEPREAIYSPLPALNQWPLSRVALNAMPPLQSRVVTPAQSLPVALKSNAIDRWQVSAWALLRQQAAGVAAPQSLASGGQLGGSQAGARLAYNFTHQIAATFRTSSEVGRRGGEIAGGMRIQPVRSIPLWITAERRQRIGQYGGGRNAFALFFEAGLYDRPMPMQFLLNTYLQGGVVGFKSRDGFIDGGLTLTRPVYKQFSAGIGVWGGAQPGLYRVDAGPRITMRVRNNLKVHVDWRQRLAGDAQPGSGPAITLSGDF